MLYSNNRLVPGNVAVDRGLRAVMTNSSDRLVQMLSEFLDAPDFDGAAHESTIRTYLREKYAARPPDAIVAVFDNALAFVLRNSAQLFPGVPLVHAVVSESYLRSLPALPDDVVGVPFEYDFAGTIEQAPVYGPLDTFIGTGVVRGRMPGFEDMGREAAKIVDAIFAGAAPASLRLPESMPTAGTVVHYRDPTFWEAYRNVAIATAAVVLLLLALVVTLLAEHFRRRRAELVVQGQRTELAHASRLAVAGELTASIAHEINQPLGAILTSADTAELLLQSGADRRDDLRRIVTRIRRDVLRANEVIQRLRGLLARHEPERRAFELNAAISDVAILLQAEARRREVLLDFEPATRAVFVLGDQIQIQQVLINLVLNAMDAVADVPEDRRAVVVSVETIASGISIAVRDRGHGIAHEHLLKLFDSFFSTKQRGMGLGLSIARTIVEAHGGRIWTESGLGEGAVFHVELPASVAAGIPSPDPA